MAFTRAHKEYIIQCIGHMLDFPETETEKAVEIQQLIFAINAKELPEENDYYHLRECLYRPQHYLKRLEDYSDSAFSIPELQSFLLDIIAEHFNLPESKQKAIGWNKQELLQQIKHEDIPFESVRAHHFEIEPLFTQMDDTFLYQMQSDPNTTYEVIAQILFPDSVLHITVDFAGEKETYVRKFGTAALIDRYGDNIPILFDSTNERERYLELSYAAIDTFVTKFVARMALHKLHEKDVVHDKHAHLDVAASMLITDPFYYSALLNHKIQFEDICFITQRSLDVYLNENIKKLLDADVIDRLKIILMKESTFKVLKHPHYCAHLLNHKDDYYHLEAISNEQANILNTPAIVHLLQKNKLALIDAIIMRKHVAQLICDPFYFERLMHAEDFNVEALLQLNILQCEDLLKSESKEIISEQNISIECVLNETDKTIRWIDLFSRNHISYWYKCGYINMTDLDEPNELNALSIIHSRRLMDIYLCRPFSSPRTHGADSAQEVKIDGMAYAGRYGINPDVIKRDTLFKFLLLLKRHFLKKIGKVTHADGKIIRNMIQLIDCATESPYLSTADSLDKCLCEILHTAEENLKTKTQTYKASMFHDAQQKVTPSNIKNKTTRRIFQRLKNIERFIDYNEYILDKMIARRKI